MTPSDGSPEGARAVTVDPESAGQRIDNFLLSLLKGVPRSRVYRLLRTGEVRINKGRTRPDYRLAAGDVVRIPPVRTGDAGSPLSEVGLDQLARLRHAIVYEGPDLLVIDKPAGLAVHGGSGLRYGAIEALRQIYPEVRSLELVHRLDRDTSGCLLVSKRRSTLRALHELMRAGKVDKRYLALLAGRVSWQHWREDAPLRKNVLRSGEREVRVDADGNRSLTLFRRIQCYDRATLVEVTLVTGRTHQIRVHAAHIGHPVLGDTKYGDPDANKAMRALGLRRLFLHANALSFRLEGETESFQVRCTLPVELRKVVEKLQATK